MSIDRVVLGVRHTLWSWSALYLTKMFVYLLRFRRRSDIAINYNSLTDHIGGRCSSSTLNLTQTSQDESPLSLPLQHPTPILPPNPVPHTPQLNRNTKLHKHTRQHNSTHPRSPPPTQPNKLTSPTPTTPGSPPQTQIAPYKPPPPQDQVSTPPATQPTARPDPTAHIASVRRAPRPRFGRIAVGLYAHDMRGDGRACLVAGWRGLLLGGRCPLRARLGGVCR